MTIIKGIKEKSYPVWPEFSGVICEAIGSILSITVTYHKCELEAKEFNSAEYGPERSEPRIEIMESPRGIFVILYPEERHANELTRYDKNIDGKIITDPKHIIQPLCCNKRYYDKSYYNEMIRIDGHISPRCVVCNTDLDKATFEHLQKMTDEEIKPWISIIVVSVILFLATVGFIIARA